MGISTDYYTRLLPLILLRLLFLALGYAGDKRFSCRGGV